MAASITRLDRIAILGCGRMALHHAAALTAAGAKVVAGSTQRPDSPNWRVFHAAFPDARHVVDGTALLADPAVDGIVVSLPWHGIFGWLPRLLACPMPMLIEKPVALDAARLDDVLRRGFPTANKSVGFNRRFYRGVARLRKRLAMGGLKAVYATVSEDVRRHAERHGSGIVPHVPAFASSHMLDLLLHLLGPLKVIRIYRWPERGALAPFVSINGVLESETGCPVFLALNAQDPVQAGVRFLFDDGTSWLLAPLERLSVFDGCDVTPEIRGAATRRYRPRLLECLEEDAQIKPGLLEQAHAFLQGTPCHAAGLADFARVLHLIDALRGV